VDQGVVAQSTTLHDRTVKEVINKMQAEKESSATVKMVVPLQQRNLRDAQQDRARCILQGLLPEAVCFTHHHQLWI
jgi:hypothetical protein